MTLMDQLIHSPRLPQYLRELGDILKAEKPKRRRFLNEVREDQKAEFINGEVVVHSPVRFDHNDVSLNIAAILRAFVQQHNIGYVSHEKLLVSLTRNDYEPDVCFFRSENSAKFKGDQMRFPAPDLIVEVLSPSTERIDRTIKFEDYAIHGVDEYWLVDPRKRTIEQYLLAGNEYALEFKSRTGRIKSRAIRGLELPVRAAFDVKENLRVLKEIMAKGE